MRKGSHHSEESKRKLSESHRGNHSALGRKLSEETKRKMSDAKKGKKFSPEHKQKLSVALVGNTRALGKSFSEEHKRKIGDAHKGRVFSPDHIKKLSIARKGLLAGERNGRWLGGIAHFPYCPKFNNAVKEEIRDKFERKCFLCGAPENGYKLHVHHCDYNKGQGCGQRWNLIPLCRSCHAKTNYNRHYHFNLLANYWACNTNVVLSEVHIW